ncbi:hypothetical protein GT347_01270 [Xylophilus rhododendri]|uniref:Uncharacterized protein n=1 Tax=Xylophilus rhododendri TaxID=2697032 RepID=A0A857J0X3_9BURK|nr:hypothetical protein [Xylophilus rhododendri]QHI96741.1 hypothetical protein GT347_01270 [Xylophilus rhododendri]
MRMHVYRLRHAGTPIPEERRRYLKPAYGELTIEMSTEHWAQLVLIARLCVGGKDVIPQLEYARLTRIRRGMLLKGSEPGRKSLDQTWLCTTEPILPFEWEGHVHGPYYT